MSKNKILIVEDNTVLLERLRNWLEQDGYEVFTAIEEPPARKIIREKEPGLVLSDVRLPKGDGLELLEWMNGNNINIPFVVMTGYSNVADAVKAMKLGAIDYLVKQCGIENIRQITNDLLRKSQRRTPQGNKFRRKSKAMQEVYDTARLAARPTYGCCCWARTVRARSCWHTISMHIANGKTSRLSLSIAAAYRKRSPNLNCSAM